MCIEFVVMAFVFVTVAAFQKLNALGCIDQRAIQKNIAHKILQPGTGYHNEPGVFYGFDLIHIQRIIVKAGYAFADQAGHGKICAFAQRGGKLVYGECGGGNIRRFCRGGAAAKNHGKYSKQNK
jgi:hypothetical protein